MFGPIDKSLKSSDRIRETRHNQISKTRLDQKYGVA